MSRRTLNAYFFRLYVVNFLSVLAGAFALIYLIDLIEVSRRGKFQDFGFEQMALFSALRVPAFMGQAFPFLILFSSIYTLLLLNRRLELVVARAAGVSIWQMIAPFLVGSLFLGLAATFLYNPFSAYTQSIAETMQADLGGDDISSAGAERIPWLRQEADGVQSVIGAQSVADRGKTLVGVSAFILNDDGVVRERVDSAKATLSDGSWVFDRPRVTRIGNTPQQLDTFSLPTKLRPEYVEQRLADPDGISIWELGAKIRIAASLGYNAMAFRMQYHTLIAQPALFIAMTLLGATVSTRFSRTGQSGRTIALGVLAGFVLYVMTFLAKALGSNSVVPPVIAAWFPVLAAGLFGTTILLHQEDG